MIDLTKTCVGIELGSTRIKAVLIDEHHIPIASSDHVWENRLVNGVWTYTMINGNIHSCGTEISGETDLLIGYGLKQIIRNQLKSLILRAFW